MEAGAAKQRTVIVVDDHKAVRQLCRIGLEAAGLRVIEAEDGAEAMERIRRDRPDPSFPISLRTGWDPQGMDPDLIRSERDKRFVLSRRVPFTLKLVDEPVKEIWLKRKIVMLGR